MKQVFDSIVFDSIVFDCDGVILDSNRLKSDAFGRALEGYDPDAIERFVEWHRNTGGVSRYRKFEEFFTSYIQVDDRDAHLERALERFAAIVFEGLLSCDYIGGFPEFLDQVSGVVPCSVNTGGDQDEVRRVLTARNIAEKFDTVLGSPATKRDNMLRLKADQMIGRRGVYFGDSQLDYELAREFGMKFVFVYGRSDWKIGKDILEKERETLMSDFGSMSDVGFTFMT